MSESTDLYGNPFADQSFTASLATHYQRVDKDFRYDDEEEEEENNSHRNRIKDDDSSQRSYMIEERESLSSLNETYPAQKIETSMTPSFLLRIPYYKEILVIEPEKIENYVSYKVITKLNDGRKFIQQRRYTDFEKLFLDLTSNYPGIIVPSMPEKKVIGRFEIEFIETRRSYFERYLQRINQHPQLSKSEKFRLFLQTPTVIEHIIPHKEESFGFLSVFENVFPSLSGPGDPWSEEQNQEIEKLESQLNQMNQGLQKVLHQRKELGFAISDFWEEVASSEDPIPPVFQSLSQLGGIQLKIEKLHQRESQYYVQNLKNLIEEYILIATSAKSVIHTRATLLKSYSHSSEKLQKKIEKGDLNTSSDDVNQLQKEVSLAKQKFEEIDQVLRKELERFHVIMKEDFKCGLSSFVHNMFEAQIEISQWWESYVKLNNIINF